MLTEASSMSLVQYRVPHKSHSAIHSSPVDLVLLLTLQTYSLETPGIKAGLSTVLAMLC
jgi:hypothetical protein